MAKFGCERYPETCDDHHPIGDTNMGDTHKLCERCQLEDKLDVCIKGQQARIVELERQRDTNAEAAKAAIAVSGRYADNIARLIDERDAALRQEEKHREVGRVVNRLYIIAGLQRDKATTLLRDWLEYSNNSTHPALRQLHARTEVLLEPDTPPAECPKCTGRTVTRQAGDETYVQCTDCGRMVLEE